MGIFRNGEDPVTIMKVAMSCIIAPLLLVSAVLEYKEYHTDNSSNNNSDSSDREKMKQT